MVQGVYWFSYVAMITDWNCWKIKNVIHFVSVEQLSVKQHKTLCPVGIPDNQPIIEPSKKIEIFSMSRTHHKQLHKQ